MRLLLISLGVTCLASVILFLYFRNRISRMEQKVDLMFQLIQEYEQNKNIQNSSRVAPTMQFTETQQGGTQESTNLISVSDDDDDDNEEYSDSDEVSDTEDNALNITETVPTENIKSISLSGAEIESLKVEPGSDDLDEISDLEETNMDDMITLEEVNNDEIEVENTEDNDDIIDEIEEVTVKKIDVVDDKPLDKRSVKELKLLAEEKGFTNYKGLRKNKLVELLATTQ